MGKSMEQVINHFVYENVRVDGNVITIHDEVVLSLHKLFGDSDYTFGNWVCDNVGEKYCVVYNSGTVAWFKDGLLHRDHDLPAIIVNDTDVLSLCWYKDGKEYKPTAEKKKRHYGVPSN